jgi:integrase
VAIDEHYPQWSVFFLTALRTGMRRGEIFGLHWDDVDLVARTITVRRSAFRGKVDSPKNGKARTIPTTARLTEALKAHRAATMMKGELVFPGSNGKIARHQNQVDRPLHGALKRAGLRRIKFHELRHSFASQLVSAGRQIKEVQELLGHATIQMTMRYAHLAPERMRDAVDVLEKRDQPVEGSVAVPIVPSEGGKLVPLR